MPAARVATAYLDHAATTPMRPEAIDAMLPFLTERFANPSGVHRSARAARRAVDVAREEVAALLGCAPGEVVFTSGGTESDNLALLGAAASRPGPIVTSAIEHDAVLGPAQALGARLAPVGPDGIVDLDALAALLDGGVVLVSLMSANNEVGTLQPLGELTEIVHRLAPDALLHSDAVQAVATLDVASLCADIDLVSVSAHKFGGPKGAGALVVRRSAAGRLAPMLRGGGQENELRPGTENVAAIVGFGAAARVHATERAATAERVRQLRDRLGDGLVAAIPEAKETGERALRTAGSLHLRIPGVLAEELLILLDDVDIAASAGSACASGALDASHVLLAMGWPITAARESIRLTLGWSSSSAEVDHALGAIPLGVKRLRGG